MSLQGHKTLFRWPKHPGPQASTVALHTGIVGSVAVARSSELRSYVPVVATVVAMVAATGAAAASPARAV